MTKKSVSSIGIIVLLFLSGCFIHLEHKNSHRIVKSKYKITAQYIDTTLQQGTGIIQGYVYDQLEDEQTDFLVKVVGLLKGDVTDSTNFFKIQINIGKYKLNVDNFIGDSLTTKKIRVENQQVIELDIRLGYSITI